MVEEAGEHPGRLEEVERVAARRRVDDHEVEAVVAVQLVQRLGRHVLLGAAQRTRRCCGRTGWRGCARPARRSPRSRARPRRTWQPVSSIIAHSSPRAPASSGSSIRWGSAASPSARPSASAEAAGRVDRDDDGSSARRAASSPSTAAVVVLPTPPDPQQHDHARRVDHDAPHGRVSAASAVTSAPRWHR